MLSLFAVPEYKLDTSYATTDSGDRIFDWLRSQNLTDASDRTVSNSGSQKKKRRQIT